jgi:hypothetical protein
MNEARKPKFVHWIVDGGPGGAGGRQSAASLREILPDASYRNTFFVVPSGAISNCRQRIAHLWSQILRPADLQVVSRSIETGRSTCGRRPPTIRSSRTPLIYFERSSHSLAISPPGRGQ